MIQFTSMKAWLIVAAAALAPICVAQENLSNLKKVGSIDERFLSYNVEMVEVIGGRFWKPYPPLSAEQPKSKGPQDPSLYEQRAPIDLTNSRLRRLASALGPAYVRVSGTWANTVYFHDTDSPAPSAPPPGFGGVLTRPQWKGVLDFAKAADAKLVTSFSAGKGTRDETGKWTDAEAKKLVRFTREQGSDIAAAEFINEPNFASLAGVPPGYNGDSFGKDYARFSAFLREAEPQALLLAPGTVYERTPSPLSTLPSTEILPHIDPRAVDGFSFHFYGAASSRCTGGEGGKGGTTAAAALGDEWLARSHRDLEFYARLRDQYLPGKPMWITETGQAACGGDRWAASFLDTFRFVDQLASSARSGIRVVMHNTLAASDYGLIDEKTLQPRPNYWAALLWHRTMGNTVLQAPEAPSSGIHLYAHCMKANPGAVTILAINLDRARPERLPLPRAAERYTLTASDLLGTEPLLNGKRLTLAADGSPAALEPEKVEKGPVELPPASISFLQFKDAANQACR